MVTWPLGLEACWVEQNWTAPHHVGLVLHAAPAGHLETLRLKLSSGREKGKLQLQLGFKLLLIPHCPLLVWWRTDSGLRMDADPHAVVAPRGLFLGTFKRPLRRAWKYQLILMEQTCGFFCGHRSCMEHLWNAKWAWTHRYNLNCCPPSDCMWKGVQAAVEKTFDFERTHSETRWYSAGAQRTWSTKVYQQN